MSSLMGHRGGASRTYRRLRNRNGWLRSFASQAPISRGEQVYESVPALRMQLMIEGRAFEKPFWLIEVRAGAEATTSPRLAKSINDNRKIKRVRPATGTAPLVGVRMSAELQRVCGAEKQA